MTAPAPDPAFQPIVLAAADGARADVLPHGAHVTRWIPAGREHSALFLAEGAQYRRGVAVRGGIPVIFPQFADRGPLPKHGFARTRPWTAMRVGADGDAMVALLRLDDDAETRAVWPNVFAAELLVSVRAATLELRLVVSNTGETPLEFTAALHGYYQVRDATAAAIHGLQGVPYRDKTSGDARHTDAEPAVRPTGAELDRVYHGAPSALVLDDGDVRLALRTSGFPDVVLWNPGEDTMHRFPDLAPDEWRRFVCVEPAVVETPVRLAPGERWEGTQLLEVTGR